MNEQLKDKWNEHIECSIKMSTPENTDSLKNEAAQSRQETIASFRVMVDGIDWGNVTPAEVVPVISEE